MTGINLTGSRIDEIKADGRAALIAYLPMGFPTVDESIIAARALVDAGVDIIELGIPYTDPVMDGGTIQEAVGIALGNGVRVADIFRVVSAVAEMGVPTLVMTYYNPVLRYGVNAFSRDLASAGGAGLITADLIPDEAAEWIAASDEYGLDRIFLVAPSSTPERLAYTAKATRGFVYAASTMGVTGARTQVGAQAERLVADTRTAGAERVCVGLGVSTAAQAADIARYADGVIVGSALVRPLLEPGDFAARVSAMQDVAAKLALGVRNIEGSPE